LNYTLEKALEIKEIMKKNNFEYIWS